MAFSLTVVCAPFAVCPAAGPSTPARHGHATTHR